MTTYEIIHDAWQNCGEPTDLAPTTVNGLTWLINALNKAKDQVVTWKGFYGKRIVKFPQYLTVGYVKNLQETVTLVDWDEDVVELSSDPTTLTVEVGDVIVYQSEVKLIYYVDGTQLYLSSAFDTYDAAIDSATIVKTTLLPIDDRVMEYLRVENVTNKEVLTKVNKRDSQISDIETQSSPTEWFKNQLRIAFVTPPDDVYLWKLTYFRLPNLNVYADYANEEDIDLPDEFHLACQAYIESLIYSHMQETDLSSARYAVYDNLMKTTQGSWDIEHDLVNGRQLNIKMN